MINMSIIIRRIKTLAQLQIKSNVKLKMINSKSDISRAELRKWNQKLLMFGRKDKKCQ